MSALSAQPQPSATPVKTADDDDDDNVDEDHAVQEDDSGKDLKRSHDTKCPADLNAEKTRYRAYAMEKYEDLFEELEFRCQRAAMMHYHVANHYSRYCYYLELAAAVLGAASVSGLGIFLAKKTDASGMTSRLGALGAFGLVISGLLEFASKGSSKLVSPICKRAANHKKAAVGWQKLMHLTRSSRIQLQNPCATVDDCVSWYSDLVRERQKVSVMAMVPSATYRAFNDLGRVLAAQRRRRNVFLTYKQMVDGKLEVDDDYDDD